MTGKAQGAVALLLVGAIVAAHVVTPVGALLVAGALWAVFIFGGPSAAAREGETNG